MYTINDCVLIRKTGAFPENGIIQTPINGLAYEFGKSTILGDAIYDKLREEYTNPEDLIREGKKYDVYFETYRRTIHFTINGVVADSLYGQFPYPFAIIEPLKHHVDDDSLETLRVEDTYFTDDMKLSDETIILIPEEEREKLTERYDLTGLNIRTYTGELEQAIKDELQQAGYDFFDVNDHGYRKGLDSGTKDSEMYTFIYEYCQAHGIPQKKHFYSDINYEDQQKRMEEAERMDELHLKYILDSGLVSEEVVERTKALLEDRRYYKKEFNELMRQVVDQVGLEKIAELTTEFNQKMISDRELRIMSKGNGREAQQTKEIANKKD